MIKIDLKLLDELGLGDLADDAKTSLLEHLYNELELRVGTTIAQELDENQLDEFESLVDENKEAEALKWLEDNYPNYKKVVEAEFEKLKTEIKSKGSELLEANETS